MRRGWGRGKKIDGLLRAAGSILIAAECFGDAGTARARAFRSPSRRSGADTEEEICHAYD
jgi:hypothetical protein